jgi:hypothetical protein
VSAVELQVATGNIKSLPLMPADHVASDIAKLRTMIGGEYFAAFGAELIHAHGYSAAWVLGMKGMHTYGRNVECPVSTSHSIQVTHATTKRLTRGVAKISPNRYRTTVLAEVDGIKVAFIASHNVNGSKAPAKYRATIAIRRALFASWRRKMRRHIKRLRSRGYTVIVGGDFNSPHVVNLHPDQVPIYNHGLMQLMVVPAAGVTVEKVGEKTRHGYTDHPLCAATIRLARQEATP